MRTTAAENRAGAHQAGHNEDGDGAFAKAADLAAHGGYHAGERGVGGHRGCAARGPLYCHEQVAAVKRHQARGGARAVLPHCDFGCEEVVGQLAKRMGCWYSIWGNRDPYPDYPGGSDGDTQCGTLASTALQRYGVLFSYILNTDVEDALLQRGFEDFCAVANVVRRFRGMRILLAARGRRRFCLVIYNEDELLRRFGIEVYPWAARHGWKPRIGSWRSGRTR